jgi:ABC-type transporter Mla subunit MlaD
MTLGSDTDPKNPKVTYADFEKAKAAVDDLNEQIEKTRSQLAKLLDNRDDSAKDLSDLNTRALSAIRGIFGPDSAEYDQAGGVRTSERKKPVRTKPVVSAKQSAA